MDPLYLYSAFLVIMTTQSAFTLHLIHPFTHIHTLMAGATTQGTNLLIRGNLTIHSHPYTVGIAIGVISGLSVLPKDWRSRESNRLPPEPQPPPINVLRYDLWLSVTLWLIVLLGIWSTVCTMVYRRNAVWSVWFGVFTVWLCISVYM